MLRHKKVQEYPNFLNYGKLQYTFFPNKDKVGICRQRAVYEPIRSFKILNYLADLREADRDYSANLDHANAVRRFFNV
jgi:hypothetical protein